MKIYKNWKKSVILLFFGFLLAFSFFFKKGDFESKSDLKIVPSHCPNNSFRRVQLAQYQGISGDDSIFALGCGQKNESIKDPEDPDYEFLGPWSEVIDPCTITDEMQNECWQLSNQKEDEQDVSQCPNLEENCLNGIDEEDFENIHCGQCQSGTSCEKSAVQAISSCYPDFTGTILTDSYSETSCRWRCRVSGNIEIDCKKYVECSNPCYQNGFLEEEFI